MKVLFYLLPILAGIAMAVQSGINSQLRLAIQHPLMASLISFLVGTIALVLLMLFSRNALPELYQYSSVRWYYYAGGLLGAFVVTVTLLSVSKIGASNMFVLIIAGQLVTAVVIDHFGLLGIKQSAVSLQKLLGILLLVVGALLVNRK